MDENWFINKSLWSRFKNAYLKDSDLKKFWKKISKENFDNDLINLINSYVNSKSYDFSSKFWNILNIRHINQIKDLGIENFATTVAMSYFTFIVYDDKKIEKLIEFIKINNINSKDYSYHIYKKQINIDLTHSINHNVLLNLLYAYVKHTKLDRYLPILEKNNFLIDKVPNIEINNNLLTQDKLNSIIEFENIEKFLRTIKSSNLNILEIGAGSGRTTETLISLLSESKQIKYVIVDIPPALYINYLRMKNNYKNKNIHVCYDINNENDFKKVFEDNDIILMLPHHLDYLKSKIFDITIAIDCLHEMDKKIIKYYMDKIDIISKNLYFKVWNETYLAYSFNNHLKAKDKKSYFIKNNWELISQENCIFPSNYIETIYKIN